MAIPIKKRIELIDNVKSIGFAATLLFLPVAFYFSLYISVKAAITLFTS